MDLIKPFSMVVCGMCGTGKTYFTYRLLKELSLPITFCYMTYQPLYDVMKRELSDIEFIEGCPSLDQIKPNSIVILDDMMLACGKEIAILFTRMRHINVSPIFIIQNFFFPNKFMRTITLNAHYLVLFRSPRDVGYVKRLGMQMYPEKSTYIEAAFKDATKTAHGYLFIDLTSHSKFRVRTGILMGEQQYAYLPTG